MNDREAVQPFLPVEFFAAKDSGVMVMTVPKRCGLQDGDTLRITGTDLLVMRDKSVLPVDLPAVSESIKERLAGLASLGKPLPVGEFSALGLVNAYFLNVVVG